jgi:hypothetical protein
MAANRCFTTFIPNQSSSDYLNTTRQKTLFKEVNNNITKLNTANPKKTNGFRYNSNFSVTPADTAGEGVSCLVSSRNHDLLMDISKGRTINKNQNINCNTINPEQQMDAPLFEAWSGNLYSVNYAEHNVDKVVEFIVPTTATADPSYCIVDPSHLLFYDSCHLTDLTGFPPLWFSAVDISFNNTTYYTEANQAQTLNGLYYPAKVTFGNTFF